MGANLILHIFFSSKLLTSHWLLLTVNRENINDIEIGILFHTGMKVLLHGRDNDLTISHVKQQPQKCPNTTLGVLPEGTQMKSSERLHRNSLSKLEAAQAILT